MKIQNNMTKTASVIISAIMIGLTLSIPSMFRVMDAQAQQTHLKVVPFTVPTNLPHKLIAPPAPAKVGCYNWTNETGWITVPCQSEAWIKSHPLMRIAEGGSSGVYGVYNPSSTALNFGESNIDITSFGSESDNITGSNAWSLQTNTNQFTGSNGHTDAVQFGYQNDPYNSNINRICVWNNDLSTSSYNPTCNTNVPVQSLAKGYAAYVEGNVNSGDTLTATFCNATNCYAATASDSYGLDSTWDQTAGQILGLSGSTATFTSSTVTDNVSVSPSTSGYTSLQVLTNEMNSMGYTSESTSCSGNTCTDSTRSS